MYTNVYNFFTTIYLQITTILHTCTMWFICCVLASSIIIQYIHIIATNIVYYVHDSKVKPLKDFGFMLLPEIPPQYQYVSEVVFFIPVILMIVESLYGLAIQDTQRIVLSLRFCLTTSMCAVLRIISFLPTVLPGPRHHCRDTSELYKPPKTYKDLLTRQNLFDGCGDLIFSNHTSILLTASLVLYQYQQYNLHWLLLNFIVFITLVIACRKHYTVDIVVGIYVTYLSYFYLEQQVSDLLILQQIKT